jgi:methionyl-tRNA formyltransferase
MITLEKLVQHGVPLVGLFTLPLSKSSRHSDYVHLEPVAAKYGVPVFPAPNINAPEVLELIRSLEPDYIFVIGWSQICRPELLIVPHIGCIGCHPAPIPENRGRAVIPWTILQGRSDTAFTLFWLDEGVDSGDIIMQQKFPVATDETATTLCEKHARHFAKMLDKVIPLLLEGKAPRIKQDLSQKATYCAKRVADDGFIDWKLPAKSVWTLIRAVTKPYPGAFTFYQGKKLVIWEADYVGEGPYWGLPGQVQAVLDAGVLVQCGDGEHVLLKSVQLENEQEVAANLLLRNHQKLGLDILSLYRKIKEL